MRSLVLALLTVVSACAGLARADDPRPIAVPFELLKSRHMAIQIKVNGKGPYRVIFDTGAPFMLLNNKVAKESGIIPKGFRKPLFAPFGSLGDFKIKTLEIGELKVHNMKTIVMDHPTVDLISQALGPIEGIVGLSFFGRFRMTLDYQTKTMTFVPTEFQPPDLIENVLKMLRPGNRTVVLAPAGQWGFQVKKDAKDTEPGVVIKTVLPDSPAARAGLKAGDRLLNMAGRWTDSIADCYSAAGAIPAGREAPLVVRRDGRELELKLKVATGL